MSPRRPVATRGEVVSDDRSERVSFFVALARTSLHAHRRLQFQHPENCVVTIRTHVTECAAPKVVPSPPHKGHVSMVARTFSRATKPHIPAHSIRNTLSFFRPS